MTKADAVEKAIPACTHRKTRHTTGHVVAEGSSVVKSAKQPGEGRGPADVTKRREMQQSDSVSVPAAHNLPDPVASSDEHAS